jgi:uncharacterized protein YjbI with pentapeptide repeats
VANPEHMKILMRGVAEWNEWRSTGFPPKIDISMSDLRRLDLEYVDFSESNLNGCKFNNANLLGADLSEANLSGADLTKAVISNADLHDSDLSGAILTSSVLTRSNFSRADLRHANLTDAKLIYTNFNWSTLEGAVFNSAICFYTSFGNVNLSGSIGVETIRIAGPCVIDFNTLALSQGKIPESFLRGCGVPEDLIAYLPSFFSQPFQYYSCFISHSSKDAAFCQRLHADLQASKVRTWYFPENAKWGRGVWSEIDRGIRLYDKLVVVCSEDSLNSGPVLREIERALNREDKEGKEVLFPIRLDGHVFAGWDHPRKADLTAKVVGDFSAWKDHDAYQKAFERLLAALQAQG